MNTQRFLSKPLKSLLLKYKIATLEDLKIALGTNVKMTVLRKLKELSYVTSYSHHGKYYTLKSIPRFNNYGLWSYKNINFSKYNTLLETIKNLVNVSEAGYCVSELLKILHVKPQEPLLILFEKKLINRKKIDGYYTYFSSDSNICKKQMLAREIKSSIPQIKNVAPRSKLLLHELRAMIILFYSTLDERQKRIYAGLESLKIGHGGDIHIAELLHLDPHTIAKGRRELLDFNVKTDNIRKKGGGRSRMEKKRRK